ncbi:MAG: cardiolipin synthase [Ruminococcus sp.]|nr:cardiolipin synthase [Ruminococcus sp.]
MDKEKKAGIKKKIKQGLTYSATQRTIVILLLVGQLLFIGYMVVSLERYSIRLQIFFQLLAGLMCIYLINRSTKSEFKISWLALMVVFPLYGAVIYFFLSNQYMTRLIRKSYASKFESTKKWLVQDEMVDESLKRTDMDVYRYSHYMNSYAGYPIQQNSEVTYFKSGEEKHPVMLEELKKARHYIFIEMFILAQGSMWDEILEVLTEKVKQGVEVRLLYDGMGSSALLPRKYDKKLREIGIKALVFQPFTPFLSSIQNNRDHRKIIVIDGHTGFTGGDNFADEYVNRIVRFGYWKDTAVMIKGQAVWNLTMMFLQMWEVNHPTELVADYDKYKPDLHMRKKYESDGYVLPYGDSPLDNEDVGMLTYLSIINSAKDYCYISTPYLIPDEEMLSALCFAAKRGVDVRVIVPGIPDKWYVKVLGESYYKQLIEAGIRLYEYNGFNHAKMFVSDDIKATVGTINLDHRSFSLHFEDACFLYNMPAVMDVKADFENMFKNECRELTLDDCNNRKLYRRMCAGAIKIIEPML